MMSVESVVSSSVQVGKIGSASTHSPWHVVLFSQLWAMPDPLYIPPLRGNGRTSNITKVSMR